MIHTHDVEQLFQVKHIKIGKSKQTGQIYFQPKTLWDTKMWLIFEPEYYYDYVEFLKEYNEYEQLHEGSSS